MDSLLRIIDLGNLGMRELLLLRLRRGRGIARIRLATLDVFRPKGQGELPPVGREHLIERGPFYCLLRIEPGRRRLAYGPIAPRLCSLLLFGEVRVTVDRDRCVVDILDDGRHSRGHIRLHHPHQGRGLACPRSLKDSSSATVPRR